MCRDKENEAKIDRGKACKLYETLLARYFISPFSYLVLGIWYFALTSTYRFRLATFSVFNQPHTVTTSNNSGVGKLFLSAHQFEEKSVVFF